MKARHIYDGSDGAATQRYYAELEKRGPVGIVAVNLFRAQKNSSRAKAYRGRAFKSMAYERKGWAIQQLCDALLKHGPSLNISFGWKRDIRQPHANWIVYIDLPNGQVSFHSPSRFAGPDYPGDWDHEHLSCHRILTFCDSVMNSTLAAVVETPQAIEASYCPACRGTCEEPLQFWASPNDGLTCTHPFHASGRIATAQLTQPIQGELF